ncbi:MAG: redoxin domain-containing protein [Deltaproteobacteria bacterium]|nr:redoxin domain-containing protein [Deltaproteobacteria bacterium]
MRFRLATILFLLLHPLLTPSGECRMLGKRLPSFTVVSGDEQVATAETLKGKIGVIFYEHKDVAELTRPAKEELNRHYAAWGKEAVRYVVRLAVIDASSAFWPATLVWKRKLRENSQSWKMTIYGDWKGDLRKSLGVEKGTTNLFVTDHRGIVRYQHAGALPAAEVERVKALLVAIYREIVPTARSTP